MEEGKEERKRGKEGRKISQREDSRVPGTKDLWNNRIDARPTSGERRDRLVSPWRPPLRSFPANSLTSRGKKIEMVRKSILVYDLLRTEQPEEGFTEKEIVEQISNKHDIMPGKSLRKQVAVALRRGVDFGIIAKKNNKFRFKSQSNVLFFFFLSLSHRSNESTIEKYMCARIHDFPRGASRFDPDTAKGNISRRTSLRRNTNRGRNKKRSAKRATKARNERKRQGERKNAKSRNQKRTLPQPKLPKSWTPNRRNLVDEPVSKVKKI